MGLLSDALRWINPPAPGPCDASHRVGSELLCDLDHPHPTEPHHDAIHGVRWQPYDDVTGVNW